MAPAIYERGLKSPLAEILPLKGTTGIMFLLSSFKIACPTEILTPECPRMMELHLVSMLALTQEVGMEFVLNAMSMSRERTGSCIDFVS